MNILTPEGTIYNESGFTSLGGPAFKLFQHLEKLFLRLASLSDAEEFHFPVFISAKELKKLDYFKSFPQLIHFPVSLKLDEENLRSFAQGEHMNAKGEMLLTEVTPICECLTPAACYHFYIGHQGMNLPTTQYFTTRAHCFRQEKFYEPLRRQRNFNMREIVCIGTAEDVKSFLARYKDLMTKVLEQLKLPVEWEIATDPFFDPESNPKFIMQQLDPVKQEMIFCKNEAEELSIGSINYHKNYFGDGFDIKVNNQTAFSGCVAFGLERWIYAITKVYGTDQSQWPKLEELKL
jgi:seryl-tRNA synthetase